MAAASEKVGSIKAQAEKIVGSYYSEFNQHPELRIYLDKLRAVAEALRERTTLILDASEPPWEVFDAEARSRVRPGAGTDEVMVGKVPGEKYEKPRDPSEEGNPPVTAPPDKEKKD